MTSGAVLNAWLSQAPEDAYVRLVSYWMSQAVLDDAGEYHADPGLTGDRLVDALVGAAVERVALQRGDGRPAWVLNPSTFLDEVWHPGLPGLLPWSLARAPGSFKVRGPLVEADSLRCA